MKEKLVKIKQEFENLMFVENRTPENTVRLHALIDESEKLGCRSLAALNDKIEELN
ncbi:MAG: hypothetical protein GY710_06200 [Desulfobacteraceae bacterium]|nr:hypothetical protein [Desulfobacteraceae bacterium]